ncbi:MAG: aldo/keto reductase [Alphaproteobacteria bacterium]
MDMIERDGARCPVLGLGTWDLRGKAARTAVAEAIALGYRHIDTARVYENEAEVGAGIADSAIARKDLFVTTKVAPANLRAADLRRSAESSLADLGCDYVDLLLIHWPNPDLPLDPSLRAMADLRDEGLTRHIGVSNFNVRRMEAAVAAGVGDIFCNQVEYHPGLSQATLLAALRAMNVPLVAYSPLDKGRAAKDATLAAIGAGHGKSAAQVTLRWLIQQPGVIAIPKAGRPEHMKANLDIFDFTLSDDEMARIHALARPDGRQTGVDAEGLDWDN